LTSVSIGGKAEVRGLCSNPYGNYLVGGAKDGSVTVFDLGVPGREKVARKISQLDGRPGIRVVAWRDKPRKEVITGDQFGLVTIWDFRSNQPVYAWMAHSDAICQMSYDEELQILITTSKDKSIKFRLYPRYGWMRRAALRHRRRL